MKIVILNGNNDPSNSKFEEYILHLGDLLVERGNEIYCYKLRDMKINNCIGCYNCWTKSPGICVFKDDMVEVLKDYINSDFVIFTSPVVMGFVTYLIKSVNERLLPLSHPYFDFLNDRFQHIQRYEKAPSVGFLLWNDDNLDSDTFDIIDKILRNTKTRRHIFTKSMDDNIKEVADEIDCL